MKKALLFFFVLLLAAGAFARGTVEDGSYVGINVTFPQIWETASEGGVDTKTHASSVGVSLDALALVTPLLGLYTSLDIFFPQEMTVSVGGFSATATSDDYDSLWGLDMLLGLGIAPLRTDRFVFSVSPGIHYTMLSADAGSAATVVYMFGVGAAVDARINLTDVFYLRAGLDLAYDCIGFRLVATGYGSAADSAAVSDFSLVPKVGIGFRF